MCEARPPNQPIWPQNWTKQIHTPQHVDFCLYPQIMVFLLLSHSPDVYPTPNLMILYDQCFPLILSVIDNQW